MPQVRDEHRTDYDAGRGGWGAQAQRERLRKELYDDVSDAPGAVAGGGGNWEDKRQGKRLNDRGNHLIMLVSQGKETPEGNPLKRERDEDEEDVDEVGRVSARTPVSMPELRLLRVSLADYELRKNHNKNHKLFDPYDHLNVSNTVSVHAQVVSRLLLLSYDTASLVCGLPRLTLGAPATLSFQL